MALPAEKLKYGTLPPMLQQYLDYKERYPDCLLFFQVGDFYELFFDDAVTTASAINLTLTSRDKQSEHPIPMCGVPLSVADQYCDRLIQLGYSVAIVSQVADAVGGTGKGMVTRRLERIITPSVKVLAGADSAAAQGLLAAVALRGSQEAALACTDVQSGVILVKDAMLVSEIPTACALHSVAEILLPKQIGAQQLDRRISWVRSLETVFDKKQIKFRYFDLTPTSQCQQLEHFASLSPLAKDAVVALMGYLDEVIVERQVPLSRIEVAKESDRVSIDATTRMNLELVKNVRDGSERGTLYEYLRFTVTPGGDRLLRNEIVSPLKIPAQINERHEKVAAFLEASDERALLRRTLSESPDIERIAARIDLEVVTPRELAALRDVLKKIPLIAQTIEPLWPELCTPSDLTAAARMCAELDEALVEEPPLSSLEGGIIKPSFHPELARLDTLESSSNSWLTQFEQEQRAVTSIPSLKVKYTSVFGYFIEVSNAHLAKVPSSYIRKQTTANAERFITEELKAQEADILQAHDKRVMLERELFTKLRSAMKSYLASLKQLHQLTARLDFVLSLAECAFVHRLTRPRIVDEPVLSIEQGQHPQIAKLLGSQFIPNELNVEGGQKASHPSILLLTGPNMGGKSTYLRQNALIAIIAQLGGFVPAVAATVGVTDQIFARLGAADNLAEGESTFMVEMREVSLIARHATAQSLVVIDEVGRGTATRDGISIAQAILEWLIVQVRARVLFATHFHELTELEALYPAIVRNVSVGSTEVDGELVFTHRIINGAATKSFGIEVAKMAGLPESIITRSKELLQRLLEKHDGKPSSKKAQLTLFTAPTPPAAPTLSATQQKVFSTLDALDVNTMTPLDALNALSQLKKLLIIVLAVCLCFCSVMHAPAFAVDRSFDELKTELLRLRNTDSTVRKIAAWKAATSDLVELAPSLSKAQAAQAIFQAATAYRAMFQALHDDTWSTHARELYERVVEEYPDATVAPESLKNLIDMLAQSDPRAAASYKERLKKEYPHSEFAELVRADEGAGAQRTKMPEQKLLTRDQKIIVLDPGHGGDDLGAVGIGGLLEKDVTLAVAEAVRDELNALPQFHVMLTRTRDVFMPLEQRTAFANQHDADIFISIHCNSSEKATLTGFELFTLDNAGDAATKKLAERENSAGAGEGVANDLSLFLSDLIQTTKAPESSALAAAVHRAVTKSFSQVEDFPVRKEKKAPFFVLVGAYMPAVLIELAFINNDSDGVMLSTESFRRSMAQSIATGIQEFFKRSS